jgi:septal ring factor EnvC (AmiA/AmiB activator)
MIGLYKLGGGSYTRLLLSTRDLGHVGQASRMVAAIAAQDRGRVEAHRRRLADLTASREALQTERVLLTRVRADAARARTAADDAVEARNLLVRQIDARRDLNARLAGELEAAQQQLQTTVGSLASAAAAPAPSAPASAAAPMPIGPFRGDLDWPVNGAVRQPFGASLASRGAPSTGIDIAASEQSAVHAIHDGTVAYADVFTGFGRLVIIDHGSRAFSLYGNLREITVARGARVSRGETVGTVGVAPTGAAGLYFELRIDGRPVDPLQWLRKR